MENNNLNNRMNHLFDLEVKRCITEYLISAYTILIDEYSNNVINITEYTDRMIALVAHANSINLEL